MNATRIAARLLAILAVAAPARAGHFEIISRAAVESDTAENGLSSTTELPAVSADGRWIAFASSARNLVSGQHVSYPGQNMFLRDRQAGTTVLASHAAGSPSSTGDASSFTAALSADGRWLVYTSLAKNLLPGQSQATQAQVLLYDRDAGTNTLVSHATSGAESAGYPETARISADGNWIVFASTAADLVPGMVRSSEPWETNVFLYEVATGQISLASRAAGNALDGVGGGSPTLSADGRWVAFQSSATNLVPGYVQSAFPGDVYLFDRVTGAMTLVSHTGASATAGASGERAVVSADGSKVAFVSQGSGLVAGGADSNGGYDAFLFTRATGANVLASRSAASATTAGDHGVDQNVPLQVSATGAYVAFAGRASDAVAGQVDPGLDDDLFLFDAAASSLALVSRSSASPAAAADRDSSLPSLSADGRFVAFQSHGSDLVAGQNDVNGYADVFLFDRTTGANVLVSGAGGSPQITGELHSFSPVLSADGSAVAFRTWAEDLAPGAVDRNGDPDVAVYDRAAGSCELATLHAPGMASETAGEFSMLASASADGRYAVLQSWARNLVPGQVDHNLGGDVFLVDRQTGAVALVSHSAAGATTAGNRESAGARISADGAWVAFSSTATDLVPGQVDSTTQATPDVFLYERATGAVTLVSHADGSATTTGDWGCGSWDFIDGYFPGDMAISADGGRIAFECYSRNLVPGQTEGNTWTDVFLYDRGSGQTSLVSHAAAAAATTANRESWSPRISADGRWVAFVSYATDLVAGVTDGNADADVFLQDRGDLGMGQTFLVSRADGTAATAASSLSERPALSPDGRWVVFSSLATNLVPGQVDPPRGSNEDDIFLFDRQTGVVELISRAAGSATAAGNGYSAYPTVSADGRYVAFSSLSTNLVPGQWGTAGGVFVHDRVTRRMELISHTGASPAQSAGVFAWPVLSADGRWVAYVAGSLFVADRQIGSLERVAGAHDYFYTGDLSTALSLPALTGDGGAVLFTSVEAPLAGSDYNDTWDVFAYVRTQPAGREFFTVAPCRLLDTRVSGPAPVSGQTLALPVRGACGVPSTATAVAVNVTVLGGTGAGRLTVAPGNVLAPGTSTLNFAAGEARANNAIVSLAFNGEGTLGLSPFVIGGGPVHVVVDVSGYFE